MTAMQPTKQPEFMIQVTREHTENLRVAAEIIRAAERAERRLEKLVNRWNRRRRRR
jgi:hypothetical protein